MTRSEDNQKTALFTGEGAYHGSSKTKKEAAPIALPFYLSEYVRKGIGTFDSFEATFPNYYDLKSSTEITQLSLNAKDILPCTSNNFLTNIFDISCQTTQLITGLGLFTAASSPIGNINHLMHKYALLKLFFNNNNYPLDITKLIANFLYHLYPFRIFEKSKN